MPSEPAPLNPQPQLPMLPAKQQQLIARLLLIEDPAERLDALLARGRRWPAPGSAPRSSVAALSASDSPTPVNDNAVH